MPTGKPRRTLQRFRILDDGKRPLTVVSLCITYYVNKSVSKKTKKKKKSANRIKYLYISFSCYQNENHWIIQKGEIGEIFCQHHALSLQIKACDKYSRVVSFGSRYAVVLRQSDGSFSPAFFNKPSVVEICYDQYLNWKKIRRKI